ncbi:MAG: EpsG family protein [Oscillospiraceae bacterium]|nr:EpsG family protein [Oscillospiraceae bacterium]
MLKIGIDKETRNNGFMLPAFFTIFFLLLALRDETIGRDLLKYKYYFQRFSNLDLEVALETKPDSLFWLLDWLVGQFTHDYQWFLAVVAGLTLLPIAKLYCEDREHGFLKIVLFVNLSTFVMIFSGLRQALAISMGLIAYEFVRKKRPFWFLICAFIAVGFHHTAFMVVGFYPLYHFPLRKKQVWVAIPVIALLFVFNRQIFSMITGPVNALLGEKYEATIEDTGSYTMLIVFALFAVLAYVLPNEDRMDKETLALRNFLLITVALQCFAPINALAMRMNYYYIIFIPILIPRVLKYSEERFGSTQRRGSVVWWVEMGITALFLLYYLYTTYVSCQTGSSALDTYPYVPFWE